MTNTIKFDENGFALSSGEVTVYITDLEGFYVSPTTEFVAEGTSLSAGVYLDAPPEPKDGYLIKRTENGWEYVKDIRGVYYRTDTGEMVEISDLNADLQNLTQIKPLALPCKWNGSEWVVDEEKLAVFTEETRSRLINQIDSHAAGIYNTWTRFASEYRERQAAAVEFKNAGFEGVPSRYISDFAKVAGIDNKTATMLILQQAEGLEKLQVELANQRMRKYELKAPNLSLEQMQSIYDDIIKVMNTLAQAYQ